jgi:hypothetical protein
MSHYYYYYYYYYYYNEIKGDEMGMACNTLETGNV